MYKEAGLAEFGVLLSCGRDFAMAEGFNPRMKLIRTKTIMEGDDVCDFCRTTFKQNRALHKQAGSRLN